MKEALAAFLKQMPAPGRPIAWQPSGPWTHEQACAFSAQIGLTLAVDPLRDEAPAGNAAYFRLGPFAVMGSRVGVYDHARLVEAAAFFETTTIVFETPLALDDVRNLKKIAME
jgi:hypothetical protein